MSVNKKCVQNMYKIIIPLLALIFIQGCAQIDEETKVLLTEDYPALYESVFDRDADALMGFTNHEKEQVRIQAWNALINTQVEDIDELINLAGSAEMGEAWASLWLKELSEDQVERLNEALSGENTTNKGLISLLGYHGNEKSLQLLLDIDIPLDSEKELELGLAISKLAANLDASEDIQIKIIERALANNNAKRTKAYLYGYYRTRNNDERKKLTSNAELKLVELWQNYYPSDPSGDQYVAALLMRNHASRVFHHFTEENFNEMDVQLAIDIARGIANNEENDPFATVALSGFLEHKNPNVVLEALRVISQKPEIAEKVNNKLLNETALNISVEERVRLAGFHASLNPEDYEEDLLTVATENSYLQNLRYSALEKIWEEPKVFDYLVADIDTSDGLLFEFLISELNSLWANADESTKTENRIDKARSILFRSIEKGIPAFTLQALYSDEEVLRDSDYERLTELLSQENSDLTLSVASILKFRFEERSKSAISSLYSDAGFDLRQGLITQEWNFIEDSLSPRTFRTPDWERLAELGTNPVWVLETPKGDIEITMSVLTAPATVSGMDSLITAGAYDGVGFHRVVPNFVIQGGDVGTGRGFGGPDYTVPTEASFQQYFRGKAGIASSGPDTEGSQYFAMNVWAPHLNGRYTIFGEVTSGMSVVDRITVGDVVERSYWK